MSIIASLACLLYFVGLLFFGLAILWDLISLRLLLRWIKTGSGPSAVPVVSWVIYYLWIMVGRGVLVSLRTGRHSPGAWGLNLRDLAILTMFHLCCQFLIPGSYARWFVRRRAAHR